ncbi:related to DNA topoisomerase 1 [Hanseniaspora guilliermondii]|uniref:DNA topoisomerase I n=1 Tax=Hanseniaspora guilliermondii TaxID=56406 RepID=A0A1L0FG10_9ASCO|nr:related to DNA topoisomerase 1 [Hanseniaspora guilliermondii]
MVSKSKDHQRSTGGQPLKKKVKLSDQKIDEEIPLSKLKAKNKTDKSKKNKIKQENQQDELSLNTLMKTSNEPQKVKNEPKSENFDSATNIKSEGDSEDSYKWWEEGINDGIKKWDTLQHNGVMFPPPYEPLPTNVKLIYDGVPVKLPPEAEEVAGFFGVMINTDHAKNPVFQKNFFSDFKKVLKKAGGVIEPKDTKITSFKKCDFSKMFEYYETKREERKQLSRAEKKKLKEERDKMEEPYKYCILDGRKEQVGNFRVEPPSLFRGRGQHPRTGSLKTRVYPEDIILNLGPGSPIPEPPAGHKWGEIRRDNTVQWLAMWKENIFNSVKYVRFAANSSLKGISDYKKFEKARELKNHIDVIREDYSKNLRSKVMFERQVAVATYLIDVFALRAGGEKGEDEADTVGCCSLRYEHIELSEPNNVTFDFLGKDSIRFYQKVEVDQQVFKSLKLFKKSPKKKGDQLFDRLDPSILNKHLQGYMPGLTAKVFRTYNASKTMQDQIDSMDIKLEDTVQEKLLKYNAANREVAILCNHQKTVSKNHESSIQKANDKIQELIWQRIRLKKCLLQINPQLKKKEKALFFEIDDFKKEKELEVVENIYEKEVIKYNRKFKNENEKRKENSEELLADEKLQEWLNTAKEYRDVLIKEVESGNLSEEFIKKCGSEEKIRNNIKKFDQRIQVAFIQLKDREDNSQVSLGTSKINYIDPRLSVMFSKKFNVPIERLFTKTLREKFTWAIESADENWRF